MSFEVDDDTIWDFGTQHNGKRLSDLPAQYLLWYWGIRGYLVTDKYHKYIHSAFNDLQREARDYIPTKDIYGRDTQ
jgi:hypothetical protein